MVALAPAAPPSISHSMISWNQISILEPMSEGMARINRCFGGVNLHDIRYTQLDWSKRIVDLLTGLVLMIPLINFVVWIFMRTYGNTELLSQPLTAVPFVPWNEAIAASEDPIISEVPVVPPTTDEVPAIQTYQTLDQSNGGTAITATWRIERYKNVYIVKRSSCEDNSEALYSTDWSLQSLKYHNEARNVHVTLKKENKAVTVTGTKEGESIEKKFPLENRNMPWIQQSFGFRPFIQSTTSGIELNFYAIDPLKISLAEMTVKKVWITTTLSDFPEYRQVVRLDTSFKSGLISYVTLASCWYDLKTGQILKLDYGYKLFNIYGNSKLISKPRTH